MGLRNETGGGLRGGVLASDLFGVSRWKATGFEHVRPVGVTRGRARGFVCPPASNV